MKFDLEKAIQSWHRELRSHPGLEPGYIEELECSLRDRIDDYLIQGMDEASAFQKAKAKSLESAEAVADEFYKARRRTHRRPPWKKRFDFFYLLPNYLKVAFRSFARKRFYTSINLLGLIIGLLCATVVFLYIQYEVGYDQFHEKSDRLYRVARTFRSQDYSVVSFDGYYSAPPKVQMKQIEGMRAVTGVKNATHFYIFDQPIFVDNGYKRLEVKQILSTNTPASFFEMFSWQFIRGNAQRVAFGSGRAVLTRSTIEKIYGKNWQTLPDLFKKTLEIEGENYLIAGVIEDIPANSHFEFSMLLHQPKIGYWGGRTYVELSPGTDPEQVAERMNASIDKINTRLAESELFGGNFLQAITSIHLYSDLLYEMKPPGELRYLYVFGAMALIILIITITNYTNLSIAMNTGRTREIGLRKVLGAGKRSIVQQFLLESVLLSLIAVPLVLILLRWVLPEFNQFMGVSLENLFIEMPLYTLGLTLGAVLVGTLSGLYPAFYLSGKKITQLFRKNGIQAKTRGFTLRKALITFQFALLIGLGSVTFLINEQLRYVDQKDLGYRREGLLYVLLENDEYSLIREKLEKMPEVQAVGAGSALGRQPFNQLTYKLDQTEEVFDDATSLFMDYGAVKAYNLDIPTVYQKYLDDPSQAPDEILLINETAAQKLARVHGIDQQDLIGRQIITEPEYTQEDGTVGFPKTIAGIFEDIHLFSLREAVGPYFLSVERDIDWTHKAVVHFQTDQLLPLLDKIGKAYREINQKTPFRYEFQEENLAELYEQERRIATLTICLSVIAFMVALLGLIALSAYLTTLRKKEVGVRKVLGASISQIVLLFNKEYIYLIGFALLIASPLAYYGVRQWLANFAYRIQVSPLVFVGAAALTLTIALVAVSSMAYRAAISNPVKSLRDDQ